jgi:hypothetical protein
MPWNCLANAEKKLTVLYGISHQTPPVTLITFRNPGLKIMKTEKIFVAVWGL